MRLTFYYYWIQLTYALEILGLDLCLRGWAWAVLRGSCSKPSVSIDDPNGREAQTCYVSGSKGSVCQRSLVSTHGC